MPQARAKGKPWTSFIAKVPCRASLTYLRRPGLAEKAMREQLPHAFAARFSC
jgi:hypothetical protein